MSVSFVADVHVHNHRRFGGSSIGGINTRCREILTALKKACLRAKKSESDAFVILGDLFDTTKPSPQVIAAVMDCLSAGHPNTLLLVGNHDQVSTYSGDHAMAPLAALPNVTVVDESKTFIEDSDTPLAVVPFRPGSAKEWLPEELEKLGDLTGYTVCVHLGIMDGETPHYMREVHDAIHVDVLRALKKEFGFRSVIAGNWHDHKFWDFSQDKLTIVQTGALVPTGFANPGLHGYGTVGLIKNERFSKHVVVGPRYIKVRSLQELENLANLDKHDPPSPHTIRARWIVPPGEISEAVAAAKDMPLSDIEVIPDEKVAQQSARSAAIAARSAETLDEAIKAFISKMDLPEGVLPKDIVEMTKSYLGG